MQSLNCEKIHSDRLQTTTVYKASAEQLITERMIENSTTFTTVRDNCYPHIRLLPTHPHLVSADFIRILPVATSAHPLITHSLQRLTVTAAGPQRPGGVGRYPFSPN